MHLPLTTCYLKHLSYLSVCCHCYFLWQLFSILVAGCESCRVARYAGVVDSCTCGGPELLRSHPQGQLGRSRDMPPHWVLLAARAHSGIGWIQELFHAASWCIQHHRHHSSASISSLDSGSWPHLEIFWGSAVCSWWMYCGWSIINIIQVPSSAVIYSIFDCLCKFAGSVSHAVGV